jgi:methyl-accepting chemotaxis protein
MWRKLFPRMSLKWKIFMGCFWLVVAILAVNYHYSKWMLYKSASTGLEMEGIYRRYESFQRAMAQGLDATVDVWASSKPLQEACSRGDDSQNRPLLEAVESNLAKSLKPDFVILVDKHGDATVSKGSPIEPSDVPTMRLFADLRQGMPVSNAIVEHKKRAYLVAADPIFHDHDVIGSIAIGIRLERVFSDFKAQSNDDPKKQVEMALVRVGMTTASSAPFDDWDDIARAVRPEAREMISEGRYRISVVTLPSGRHDYYAALLNGFEGVSSGNVGSLNIMRNRAGKEAHLNELVEGSLFMALIALAVAAIVSWILSVFVTRPINQFIAATHDLAHGEGDLTRRLEVTSSATEMQTLAENLNAMFANLHKLASEVQGASFQVGASSAEISAASKQMLSGAKDQATRIESSTAAVTELSSSIQQVAENATQATKVAKESGDSLSRGITQLGDTSTLIQDTARTVLLLGEGGKRIGSIVEVIRQISEQTSLLALNASIEAAHAGEQGRGFAVVADEVAALARRVGQSAKDIEGLIATISQQTAEAVSSMQGVTRAFAEHVQGANAMKLSLGQIIDVIQDTARSVQEQAVVSDEIARNMDAVQKIAQEVLGSSEEAVVQGEALHALALRLEELVRNFRIEHDGSAGDGDGRGANGGRTLPPAARPAALPERGAATERRRVARS